MLTAARAFARSISSSMTSRGTTMRAPTRLAGGEGPGERQGRDGGADEPACESVEAHHQARLVPVEQPPERRPGDQPRQGEAQHDHAEGRARAGQLQDEPEERDGGEVVAETRGDQPEPEAPERRAARRGEAVRGGRGARCRHRTTPPRARRRSQSGASRARNAPRAQPRMASSPASGSPLVIRVGFNHG